MGWDDTAEYEFKRIPKSAQFGLYQEFAEYVRL